MNVQEPSTNISNQDGDDLYDEFGNYIGPDLDSSSEEESDDEEEEDEQQDHDDENDEDESMTDNNNIDTINDNHNQMIIEHESSAMAPAQNQIVLHEDKIHYPSAETVYGPNVTTAVIDEDAMDIETPIIPPSAPTMTTTSSSRNNHGLDGYYEDDKHHIVKDEYLINLLDGNMSCSRSRGIAICGKLHSGKSSFIDLLRAHTFLPSDQSSHMSSRTPQRYTHRLITEQKHNMTLSSTPLTLPLTNSNGQTFAFTIMDTPGHLQFHDEVIASLKLMDGCCIIIDIVEGMTLMDEIILSSCIAHGLPIVIMLHKIDRLILDLKLPLNDAYVKIKHILDSVNVFVRKKANGRYPLFLPLNGNVLFGSSLHGYIFSLESMADLYMDHNAMDHEEEDDDDNSDELLDDDDYNTEYSSKSQRKKKLNSSMFGTNIFGKQNLTRQEFIKRLWGNTYYNEETRTFSKKPISSRDQRSFCTFILEPLYKLYGLCLGEKEKDLNKELRALGIFLSKDQLRSDVHSLLNIVMKKFYGDCRSFVDVIVKNVPTPSTAAFGKVSRCYTGGMNTNIAHSMMKCDPNGKLMVHITKLYANGMSNIIATNGASKMTAGETFSAFGRIYSGSIKPGDRVRVLGEAYSPEDDEDVAFAIVKSVSIPRGRYKTEVNVAKAGNWVLIDGIDASISKTATIASSNEDDEVEIFAPLKFSQVGGESVVKLSVEPLNPAELPKMVEGLRRVSKAYPMAVTRVEESGEHVVFGTGELYLDCIMHDLRHVYSNIEVKVADPVVSFRETVVETSSIKCFAETANKRNKLTMIAEPLDEGLAEELEAGKVKITEWDKKKVGRYFQSKYDWDLLSARSVWAFHGPNILMDDTLPSEVDNALLSTCKSGIIQGFQWATREGPLCEEPVRSTKLKILDTVLADKPIHRGAGQIIPTARKVVHSSLLTAQPKLLEPIHMLEIQVRGDIVDAINPLITKRRGHIVQDKPIPGSPFYLLKAFMPVIDSFGFETDLRVFTQGHAMIQSVFDHWAVVPGDPLDKSIILHPLEPSPPQHLARDFLVKTRRRKGLSEDVNIVNFFDESMINHMNS